MCNLKIEHSNLTDGHLEKFHAVIKKAGGTVEICTEVTEFHIPTAIGKVKGSYTVCEEHIEIVISEKPIFLSCKMIEKEIRNYAAGAV